MIEFQKTDEELSQTCGFCDKTVEGQVAVDHGWVMTFTLPDDQDADIAVCPSCSAVHIEDRSADGYYLKPGSPLPDPKARRRADRFVVQG